MNGKITFTDDEKRKLFDPLYDYSNEGANEAYTKLNGVEKFLAYMSVIHHGKFNLRNLDGKNLDFFKNGQERAKKAAEAFGEVKDPDSGSELVQKLYAALWYDKNINSCMKIQGETLNSVNTTLNLFYEDKDHLKKLNKESNTNQNISIYYILSRYFEHHDDFSQKRDNMSFLWESEFEKFVSVYHTLGNFMPVPCGCNRPRGSAKVQDYWDLTLLNIFKYYTENNEQCIQDIIGEKEELVERYKTWLDCFGNWENFVNKNYLHAFVYYKHDGTLYPKELWNGHFDKYESCDLAIPQETAQYKEYFKNAANRIRERTFHLLGAFQGVL